LGHPEVAATEPEGELLWCAATEPITDNTASAAAVKTRTL